MPQTTLSGKNRYKTENSRINLKAWQVKKKHSLLKNGLKVKVDSNKTALYELTCRLLEAIQIGGLEG